MMMMMLANEEQQAPLLSNASKRMVINNQKVYNLITRSFPFTSHDPLIIIFCTKTLENLVLEQLTLMN